MNSLSAAPAACYRWVGFRVIQLPSYHFGRFPALVTVCWHQISVWGGSVLFVLTMCSFDFCKLLKSSEYHEITSFLRSSLARCCPTRQLFHVFLLWCAVTAKCLEKLIWTTAALGVINLSKYKVQFPWSCHRRSPYSYNHPQPELGCVSLNLFHFTQNNQIFIMWVSVCVAVAEGLGCSPGRWETLFPVTAPMNI